MASPSDDSKSATAPKLEFPQSGELAAVGLAIVEEEKTLGLAVSARLHWKILATCLAAATAGLAFGYDTVVNAASISMPSFLLYFGEIGPTGPYLPSVWTSLWTAMSSLAQALGSFFVGYLSDRFGRKVVVPFNNSGSLLAGKMVNGLGIGAAMATATAYASEIAPINLRGPIQSGLVLFTVVMQGLALGVIRIFVPDVQEKAFRSVIAIQWAVGALLTLAFLFVPESPVYLITHNRIHAARKTLVRLYGSTNSIDARLAYLAKTIRDKDSKKELEPGRYIDCFNRMNIKRTLTVVFVFSAIGMGDGTFLTQNIYFLIIAGLKPVDCFDVGVGGFMLAAIFIVMSWGVLDRIGRRIVFISGGIVNALGMLVIGCLSYAPGTGALWAIAVITNVLISWQSVSLLSSGWVIVAELSSYRLRGKTQAIGVVAYAVFTWFFTFIIAYIYNVDVGNLVAKTGFVFMGTGIVFSAISWWLIPDTAGLTMEEVDWLYSRKISARKFKDHVEEMKEHLASAAKIAEV